MAMQGHRRVSLAMGCGRTEGRGVRQSLQSVGSAAFLTHRPQDGAVESNPV